MRRAVLWDLDGTLVDSADHHFESWVSALAAEGRTVTRAQFQATFGQRNDRILASWLGPSVPRELTERIADAKEIAYRRFVRERGVVVLPGAADCLERLHARRWRQAIASSAPRANVETVVAVLGWSMYFEALVAAEDVRRGKPDPEVFATAAARLGVNAGSSIVVEDAPSGIEAARRAGMKSIGVGPAAASAQPDVPVVSLADLPPDVWDRLIGVDLP
jgi:HAD superfamily hydrolase (TIGR01509 family)